MAQLTKDQAQRLLKYKRATSKLRLDRLYDTWTETEAHKLEKAVIKPGEKPKPKGIKP